jgi:hypothetical protein
MIARPGAAAEGKYAARPLPPKKDNTALYVGGGVGGLILVIVLALAMSGGDSEKKAAGGYPKFVSRKYKEAVAAHDADRYDEALSILAEVLNDPKYKSTPMTAECRKLDATVRERIRFNEEGRAKIADFTKKIEQAKKDQTAMKQADALMAECKQLLGTYGQIPAAKALRDHQDDLRRWVATESQSDWQNNFNIRRDRIQKENLAAGDFAGAVKRWRQFGEESNDPIFRKKIEEEVADVNRQSVEAARALAAGSSDRATLESDMARFVGTDGQDVIRQKLKGMK